MAAQLANKPSNVIILRNTRTDFKKAMAGAKTPKVIVFHSMHPEELTGLVPERKVSGKPLHAHYGSDVLFIRYPKRMTAKPLLPRAGMLYLEGLERIEKGKTDHLARKPYTHQDVPLTQAQLSACAATVRKERLDQAQRIVGELRTKITGDMEKDRETIKNTTDRENSFRQHSSLDAQFAHDVFRQEATRKTLGLHGITQEMLASFVSQYTQQFRALMPFEEIKLSELARRRFPKAKMVLLHSMYDEGNLLLPESPTPDRRIIEAAASAGLEIDKTTWRPSRMTIERGLPQFPEPSKQLFDPHAWVAATAIGGEQVATGYLINNTLRPEQKTRYQQKYAASAKAFLDKLLEPEDRAEQKPAPAPRHKGLLGLFRRRRQPSP